MSCGIAPGRSRIAFTRRSRLRSTTTARPPPRPRPPPPPPPLALEVDDDRAPRELARDERIPAAGGEVHVIGPRAVRQPQRVAQAHRVRLAEVEPAMGLGDDDRPPPVR